MFSRSNMELAAEVAPLLTSLLVVLTVLTRKAILVWSPTIFPSAATLRSMFIALLQLLLAVACGMRLISLALSAYDDLFYDPSLVRVLGRPFLIARSSSLMVSNLLKTMAAIHIIDLAAADELAELVEKCRSIRLRSLAHFSEIDEAMKLPAASSATADRCKVASEHAVTKGKDQGGAIDATGPCKEGDDTSVDDTATEQGATMQSDFHELTRSDFEGWSKPQ
ncbi:hypothetical protein LTR56_018315 [Elasticomyces elasticus]|nr:hypothetical protein LTR22_025915 [Elasticomyces elasticus]KAK3628960.1 hypothetical protein LTR56_018315 [Elasticomyces elasticus]KAK4909233.1 hypothetical protein LTR49_021985 [Elasticomyces elasticus]KAK5758862.1 hypothetical protein LTS12_010955 [Elasticomyces elasticus]